MTFGIQPNHLSFMELLGDHCRMNLNENLVNCDSFTSAVISRICGA